jgi:hypothetical protein
VSTVIGEIGDFITVGAGLLRVTSPLIGTSILDSNGNELIVLTATASAVNEITLANAATGGNPSITASGVDTDISLTLAAKGAGVLTFTKKILLNTGAGSLDNLIYVGATTAVNVNASFGFFVAGVGSSTAGNGPYFLARGNTFSALSDQRGTMFFVAGNPSGPNATEGIIRFFTGNETERLRLTNDGFIFQRAPSSAPTDGDIPNNFIVCYLNEAGNELKIRVRYSDGTLKLATIALA